MNMLEMHISTGEKKNYINFYCRQENSVVVASVETSV